jgi:hypothetical protein
MRVKIRETRHVASSFHSTPQSHEAEDKEILAREGLQFPSPRKLGGRAQIRAENNPIEILCFSRPRERVSCPLCLSCVEAQSLLVG